jgi:membrane protease YdiL (CAAX protease family)
VAAACLTGRHFGSEWIESLNTNFFPGLTVDLFQGSNLGQLFYWLLAQYTFLLVIPAVFLYWVRPKAFSMFSIPPLNSMAIYGLLFLFMFPLLILVSGYAGFPDTYPFLRFENGNFNWSWFILWELLYFLQFVAIEFFFRGFLLSGLLPVFGESAIAVSILPYVMIHYGKPFPEIAGAFFAGWILGRLALRSGSIIPGILLHYAVALIMDLISLQW